MRSESLRSSADFCEDRVLKPVMKCPVCGEAMVVGECCVCGYEDTAYIKHR